MKQKIIRHKNVVLFMLLVLGLTATYFFEERTNAINERLEIKKTALLNADDLGDLTSIQGIKLNFEKRGEDFHDKENGFRLGPNKIGEFFQILSGLKVKRFLDPKEVEKVGESFYVSDPSMKMTFHFKKGEMSFVLGKKLPYDQSFYMRVFKNGASQFVVVQDESPDPGVYQDDEEYKRSEFKYKRLEMLFLLTNKFFYDARVFAEFNYAVDRINFKAMSIATFRNKKFSISFKDTTTTPPAPKGISYFEENWTSFHQALSKLEGKSVRYPAKAQDLDEALSLVEVEDREGRKYSLELYKKYGDERGYFLKNSFNSIVYELNPPDAQYFLVNVQDFWQKKMAPEGREFPLELTFFNHKSETVRVVDTELFKVTPQSSGFTADRVRPLEFKKFLDFLKSEGNHVSEVTEKPSDLLKKSVLSAHFENRTLNVILEDNEAVIVDLDLKLKVHYYVGAKLPFSIKYEDYFIVAKK